MYKIPLILSKIYPCLVFSWFKKIRISLMPDLDSVHFHEHNDIFYVNTLQKLNKWDEKKGVSQTSEINYSFVPLFNIAILKIFQSPVTLRIMLRSNGWYGTKVLVRTIIWHIEKNLALKNLLIISKSCSHWNTLEKWTLAYKIGLMWGLGSSVHIVLACQSEGWGFDPRSGHLGCTLEKGALPAISSVHPSCK